VTRYEKRIVNMDRVLRLGSVSRFPGRVEVLIAHADRCETTAAVLARDGVGTFETVSYHQAKLREAGALDSSDRSGDGHIRLYRLTEFGAELVDALTSFDRRRAAGAG
jgi:DNA-binding transcriptional ArsR family regulator